MEIVLYEVVNSEMIDYELNCMDSSEMVVGMTVKSVDKVTGFSDEKWIISRVDKTLKIEVCKDEDGSKLIFGMMNNMGLRIYEDELYITKNNGKYWIILLFDGFIVVHDGCLSYKRNTADRFAWLHCYSRFVPVDDMTIHGIRNTK